MSFEQDYGHVANDMARLANNTEGLWRLIWDLLLSLTFKARDRACNQSKYPNEKFATSQSIRTWALGRLRWMPCPSRASFLFVPEATALKFKAKISHSVEHPQQKSAQKLLAKCFPHRQEPHAQHQVFFSGAQTFSLQSRPIFEGSRCESNMVQLTTARHVVNSCKLQQSLPVSCLSPPPNSPPVLRSPWQVKWTQRSGCVWNKSGI